jgi:gas vesicle protein
MKKDSATLQHEIENTFGRIDRTAALLAERLTLRAQLDGASDWLREKLQSAKPDLHAGDITDRLGRAGRRTSHVIGENPLAVGLGALSTAAAIASKYFWNREPRHDEHDEESHDGMVLSSSGDTMYHDPVSHPKPAWSEGRGDGSHRLRTAREKASEWSESMRESGRKARQMTSSAKQGIERVSSRTKDSISRAAHSGAEKSRELADHTRERFDRARNEFPLTTCVGALATGLLAAIVIPSTRRENRMYGEQSANLKDKVREKGEELRDDAKSMAEEATGKAKDKLHEKRLDPEGLAQRAGEAVDRVSDEANRGIEKHVEPGPSSDGRTNPAHSSAGSGPKPS